MMIFEFALWIVWVVLNNCGNSKKVNIVNKVKAEKYENRIIIKIRKNLYLHLKFRILDVILISYELCIHK